MRRIIAVINMTLDGFCDHTLMIADEETHNHFTEVIRNSDLLFYGRITYQLMEGFWPAIVLNPTGEKSMDDFAVAIDKVQKIVYSRTLTDVKWKNTTLKHELIKEEIVELKNQTGGDILVGSPGLIVALTKLKLIDEYQINVQPLIAGSGLSLFTDIKEKVHLKLVKTKTFACGAVNFYYESTT